MNGITMKRADRSSKPNRPSPAIIIWILLLSIAAILVSCRKPVTPRPRGYFRIDFPAKTYQRFQSDCGYSFEVPVYGVIEKSGVRTAEACWYDLKFDQYNATVYMTYKPLHDNLPMHIEDVRKIVYKHIIKADDIIELPVNMPERDVYGIVYRIEGNTASSMNFYLTDSATGFVSGALYFDAIPNKDSLAPAIAFFQEDIMHLIHTFEWD